MTNEEAIEAIKCNWPDSRYTILREALDMAISALRQQEHFRDITKKVEPQWISVNHRLPESDGIYIVCDRRLNGYPWIHTVGFRKASSSWCELHGVYYDDGYGRYSDQDKFTHWMPLPEKPEDDDHDERKENENV